MDRIVCRIAREEDEAKSNFHACVVLRLVVRNGVRSVVSGPGVSVMFPTI